jgi:zinc/manganese transport system substrate-binding protein
MRQLSLLGAVALASCLAAGSAAAGPVKVVASENFYGDIAQQIGGANVEVTSVLTNPDQDPHLFEASASMAPITIPGWKSC